MTEVQGKLARLREEMATAKIAGVVLRGMDWFAWATAGGEGGVILTSETGVAEVFVTKARAWILTSAIEKPRFSREEIPSGFEIQAFAWEDRSAAEKFIASECQGLAVASDRPKNGESPLPRSIQKLKQVLTQEEIARYRAIGKGAAEAMTDAMKVLIKTTGPRATERELAGLGARELLSRGLDPTLILVGGQRRALAYRHPIPKDEAIGDFAMMVFCARGFGLYANLTRFVFFRDPTPEESRRFSLLREIEAKGFEATRPGRTISEVYGALAAEYEKSGFAQEIHYHHQGGPTGYLSREAIAGPADSGSAAETIQNQMAFAWNPSLPGAKVEDTVFLGEDGIEILTIDPRWPSTRISGLSRPGILKA